MTEGLARHPEVAWVDSGERIAVVRLHQLTESPVILIGSAAEIWRVLASADSETEIVAALAEVYRVETATIADSIAAWIVDAERTGLITSRR